MLLAHLGLDPEQDDTRGPVYKFIVGRDSWWEDTAGLTHPVNVQYEQSSGVYRLHTHVDDIKGILQRGA